MHRCLLHCIVRCFGSDYKSIMLLLAYYSGCSITCFFSAALISYRKIKTPENDDSIFRPILPIYDSKTQADCCSSVCFFLWVRGNCPESSNGCRHHFSTMNKNNLLIFNKLAIDFIGEFCYNDISDDMQWRLIGSKNVILLHSDR